MAEWKLLEERVFDDPPSLFWNKPIGKTMIWGCFENGVHKTWKNSGKPIVRKVLVSGSSQYYYGHLEIRTIVPNPGALQELAPVEVLVFILHPRQGEEKLMTFSGGPGRNVAHRCRTYVEPMKAKAGRRNSSDWHGPPRKHVNEEAQ